MGVIEIFLSRSILMIELLINHTNLLIYDSKKMKRIKIIFKNSI